MAVNQEENLSSGIKFDNEGFLTRCQITERENPKRFDDSFETDTSTCFLDDPMNFTGDSSCTGCKISSLDPATIRCIEAFDRETCGFKTKETSESTKVDDNEKVGSSSISEEWPYDMEDFLPFGYERYLKCSCNLVHERKGLEKDDTHAVEDCADTSLPNLPKDLDDNFDWIHEDFGSKDDDKAKKNGDYELGGYMDDKYWFPPPLNDPLLWRDIHIDHPLNDKITDDDLLRITNLAQGTLHSLSLVECRKITATALRRIFLSNPGLYQVTAVLKGETMIVNKEGYIGEFPGMRNLPSDDSHSETSYEYNADDEDSASGEVYEDFFPDDPIGWRSLPRVGSQSPMPCEEIAALLPSDPFCMGVSVSSPDDYPTDPFGVDLRKGEFSASIFDAGGFEPDDAELSDSTLMALRYHEFADRRKYGKG